MGPLYAFIFFEEGKNLQNQILKCQRFYGFLFAALAQLYHLVLSGGN